MRQPGLHQSSVNSGEISDELYSRIDLKQWSQAMKRMKKVEPIPQGGFALMQGSRLIGRRRQELVEIANTPTAAPGPHAGAATIYTLTFSADSLVAAVELAGFTPDADTGGTVTIQYQEPGSGLWFNLAPAFTLAQESRSRVAARAPGNPVLASAVRAQIADISGSTSIPVTSMTVWSEGTTWPVCRPVDFRFSSDQIYQLLFTPDLVDVWRNGAHVGAARLTPTAAQIARMKTEQEFDTLFLFHQDLEPPRIMRRGADHEWQYDNVPFEAIPEVDYGDDYPKTTDTWDIFVRWVSSSKPYLYLNLIIDGEETGAIIAPDTEPNDLSNWLPLIKTAVEGLASVADGVTVTKEPDGEAKAYQIRIAFTGEDNVGKPFDLSAQIVNTSEASALATHIIIGDTDGEALQSATRGWPGAGIKFGDRLIMAGFKSKKAALALSRVGEFFDFDIKPIGDSTAILDNLGGSGSEEITNLFVSRHLLIFTDVREYFVSDRVIVKNTPRNFVETSKHGANPEAAIVEADESIYYVGKEGSLIYSAFYDDVATKYLSRAASLLASHLIEGVVDLAVQVASEKTDASRLWARRSDGRLIMASIIENEDILGFCEWATDGVVDGVMVGGDNTTYLTTRRTVEGGEVGLFEKLEDDLLFDGAITKLLSPAGTTVDGLEAHEGATVYADADGFIYGPFTVDNGAIELPEVATNVTVGRWTAPIAETLPQITVLRDRVVILRPARIHTVNANIKETTSIAIGANGGPTRNVELYRAGMATDAPLTPQTRWIAAEGIEGHDVGPTVVFTQTKPGKLRVTAWALERT